MDILTPIIIIIIILVITCASYSYVVSKENEKLSNRNHELKRRCEILESKLAKIEDAELEANRIINRAKEETKKINALANEDREKIKLYEKTITAMNNIIQGYGNNYIIPSQTLFDELADNYDYTKISQDYKKIRSKFRNMIKIAGDKYKSNQQVQLLVNLILDVFQEKTNTIIAKAKSDNFGTLKQKLTDAFTIVQYNSKNSVKLTIDKEFLNTRIEELRLACLLSEIHKKDMEEQRRIKEQMREEEKVRRETEKAMREAAKEEEMLQKAMEKVKAQLEQANAEQRAIYETQIAELQQKYLEAEERNKRALSMAQQTKSGHVYIISNEGSFGKNVFKIGMTRRLEPLDRIKELSNASVPFSFDVHALIYSDDAPALETMLHKKFALAQVNKVNFRKEFFKLPLSEIRSELEKEKLNVKWTMTAEASEYHESIVIEKTIKEDEKAREDWLKHQLEFEKQPFNFFAKNKYIKDEDENEDEEI